jgi:hypothetical protein
MTPSLTAFLDQTTQPLFFAPRYAVPLAAFAEVHLTAGKPQIKAGGAHDLDDAIGDSNRRAGPPAGVGLAPGGAAGGKRDDVVRRAGLVGMFQPFNTHRSLHREGRG